MILETLQVLKLLACRRRNDRVNKYNHGDNKANDHNYSHNDICCCTVLLEISLSIFVALDAKDSDKNTPDD